ncbi:hypothetical protein B0T10DRAFT_509672 [Thelonectria olida]|uniref:ZW10 C-terminal helical domain-containing protein n=1 Tax=Thelonectria olida TaxID=1576542 RepID=A0A9P8W955_9HYPO|nr:hypothetical protein B0T10DRAFT_509672 [Thelonectria olida]
MAATVESHPRQLSDALVAFCVDNRFPDDVSVFPAVSETNLQPAIDSLDKKKQELKTELHAVEQETNEDVSTWARTHKALQADIVRLKAIQNEVVQLSEAPAGSGEAVEEAEQKIEFLNREVQYSQQLHGALRRVHNVTNLLNQVEAAKDERRIIDSLHLLEQSWAAQDQIGVSKTCRVMRLLDIRSFELKSAVHEVFDHVWKALVHTDIESRKVVIYDSIVDEQMSLADAVVGLKAYKEVEERMEQLWRNLDAAVVSPRMDNRNSTVPSVQVQGETLQLSGHGDQSVESLLSDLETVIVFLNKRLPPDLLPSLGQFMMADIIPRLVQQCLNSAVPTSLKDMDKFQATIERARQFCETLENNEYTGFDELKHWVDNAPSIWLGKCRESSLAEVRSRLLDGIGEPKQVEKVEKQMVSISEGKELSKSTQATAAVEGNDWGDAWGDAWDEDDSQTKEEPKAKSKAPVSTESKVAEDDGADAWGWDDDTTEDTPEQKKGDNQDDGDDDDDSAAAWGWGDEDTTQEPEVEPTQKPTPARAQEATRELVLRETYSISSMPEPVLELIYAILEDAARLTREDGEYSHVTATAPGLFSLPTFALALFRGISPYYYSLADGGNMFLYNDTKYLAEQLSQFSVNWKQRDDLSQRARNMLRLDNDIKSLQSFANRSYAGEMNIQKTILRDLLGGAQSLMQQDETEMCIESGTARIRTMAATWEPILAGSVWQQAIGSLADALATKMITDVLEMPSISQDEAYNIASFIAKATELDDLFPSTDGGSHPRTAQFAPSWLRLKYLSEVLQSNLNEVRYLWFESELSVHFTSNEVVDLIEASFEANPRTRETIREIQAKPAPMAG